jgi:hypothetical protein
MGDFENRTFVVTGYEAFQQRTFQEDGHVSTRTHLRLEVQRETGPSDRPVTLTYVTFTAHPEDNTHKIGKIAKRSPPHAREFELDVTLPAADFDHYWKILTQERKPRLRCVIAPIHGNDIGDFTLATAEFHEGELP